MGNINDSKTKEFEKEQFGEKIYRMAAKMIPNDQALAEKITGMVMEINYETLKHLVEKNPKELARRLEQAAYSLERDIPMEEKNKHQNKDVKSTQARNENLMNHELCVHLKRFYPDSEAELAADALQKLNRNELDRILSSPSNLESFIRQLFHTMNCGETESTLNQNDCNTVNASNNSDGTDIAGEKNKWSGLQFKSSVRKKSDSLTDEEIQQLIGDQLYQKISQWYPGLAEKLTGVLIELQHDVILQLLASDTIFVETIAVVFKELHDTGNLTERDICNIQEYLGNIIYAKLEKDCTFDDASYVTGMLLEMDIWDLQRLLGDEKLFNDKVQLALATLRQKGTS